MAVQPFPNPRFRAFDANGDPLAGGLLYTYSAGTSTPRATYTTRAGDVANVNPVVLDANGEANVWTTPGVDYKFELRNSAGVVQWTVDNIPSPPETSTTDDVVFDPGGRLSLTSGTPVSGDVTGASIVYYVPYKHNKVPLWDGTAWAPHSITSELSQAEGDTTKSPASAAGVTGNYDMFVWSDAGILRCTRGPVWPTDTSRGSGAGTSQITQLNGRYVNAVSITNGPAANRGLYVGTIRNTTLGIYDSIAYRHVWNMYHRVRRTMRQLESTDTWSYGTATTRQANGNGANQLSMVRGLNEDAVFAAVSAVAQATAAGTSMAGVGLDSATTFATGFVSTNWSIAVANVPFQIGGTWHGLPGIGHHYLAWLERGNGGTVTWFGDNGTPTLTFCGIYGDCWA